jgi:carotenoid cleavage dioxygenase-like enzyme
MQTSSQAVPFPKSCMTTSREEFTDLKLNILEGDLPDDLCGHAFIIGPTGTGSSSGRKPLYPSGDGSALFNGDGMIYRLDFHRDEITLTNQIIRTPCFYADHASRSGSKYANLRFRNLGLGRISLILGFRDAVNTALVPFKFSSEKTKDEHWRILATWDVGRPYEIDPKTLKVITPIGSNKDWEEQYLPLFVDRPFIFKFCTTGTHPVFDKENNDLFMINWSRSIWTILGPMIDNIVKTKFKKISDSINKLISGLFKSPAKLLQKSIESINYVLKNPDKIKQNLCNKAELILLLISQLQLFIRFIINGKDFIYLLRWDGDKIKKWKVVDSNKKSVKIRQSMHQIGISRDYIVLIDTAFKTGLEQILVDPIANKQGLEKYRDIINYPQSPRTRFYVIRRADLKLDRSLVEAKEIEIDREIAHFLVNYENPDNTITLHCAHNCAWDPAEWVHDYDAKFNDKKNPIGHDLVGMTVGPADISYLGRHTIQMTADRLEIKDPPEIIKDDNLTWATAIYAHNSITPQKQYKNIYWVSWGFWPELLTEFIAEMYEPYNFRTLSKDEIHEIAESGKPSSLFRLDPTTMRILDSYKFPGGYFGNSPQFVPRLEAKNTENSTNGYIVCAVLYGESNSELWIFDAAKLANGPLCKIGHSALKLGLTIHTTWLSEIAPHTSDYRISIQDDYESSINEQPPAIREEIKEMFQKEVYPHFK